MPRRNLNYLLVVVMALGGCGDDKECEPQTSDSCTCPGNLTGTRTCTANGKWGPCSSCGSLSDAGQDGALDGAGGDADASDAAASDADASDAAASDAVPEALLSDALQPDGPSDIGPVDAGTAKYPWNTVPLPSGTENLWDVWGSSASDVYAVGDKGTIIHFDGRKPSGGVWWSTVTSPSSNLLTGVWGGGPRQVYIVGQGGVILQYDGSKWSAMSSGASATFRAIWGSSSSDIWALGEFGLLYHNTRDVNPNIWRAVKSGTKRTLLSGWGSGASDIFAVGALGTIQHHDGTAWTAQSSGTTGHLWGIWGSGSKNVWAVGESGLVLRYDGSAWKSVDHKQTKSSLLDVWGSGASDVWAVGESGVILRYDGSKWKKILSGTSVTLRGVWGTGPRNIYAVGDKFTVLHYAPCDCTISGRCYQSGDRQTDGCTGCVPSISSTVFSGISGDCYVSSQCLKKGELDSTGCKACDPTKNTYAWTSLADVCTINGLCFAKGAPGPRSCDHCDPAKSKTGWSVAPNTCQVGSACYPNGGKDTTGCKVCDPTKSSTSLQAVPNTCLIGGTCYSDGAADTTASCRFCKYAKNPSGWTVSTGYCYINGKCVTSGTKDTSGCLVCDPARSTTKWSSYNSKCLINNICYSKGARDSTGCKNCDPVKDPMAWTMIAGKCLISGSCYNSGTKDTSGCRTCDPSTSTSDWTVMSTKCYIGGTCMATGAKDTTGCLSCDPTKSKTSWTNASCPVQSTVRKVTFAHGSSPSSMTLATVNTDGTGYAAVPGFGTLDLNQYSYVFGRVRQYLQFSRDEPFHKSNLPYHPIELPKAQGLIKWYRDSSAGRVGVMLFRADGTVEKLYDTPGSSTSYLYPYFAVSDDGKFVATHRPQKGLVLMRTDKGTYSSGKPYLELNPSPSPYYIFPNSVTLTNNHVFMVTRSTSSSSSQHTLWMAPTDGSSGITQVTLPKVSSINPIFIDDEIAFSEDGSVVVVTAGHPYSSYSNNEDVIAIDTATRAATNISKSPTRYMERSDYWGISNSGCQLAVSTKGTYSAYVAYNSSYRYDLYISKNDGTGSRIHVSSSSNFSGSYFRPYSLKWLDDDTLLFGAYGNNSSYSDVFVYKVSTATVTNVTQQNSTSRPFNLSYTRRYFYTYGMWFSPNRRYLYMFAYNYNSYGNTIDLWVLDSSWGLTKLTSGANIHTSDDTMEACVTGSLFFFTARPPGEYYSRYQLYYLDLNAPKAPVKLTNLTSSSYRYSTYPYDVTTSRDCTRVAYRHYYYSPERYDVYSIKIGTSPVSYKHTDGSTYYSDDYLRYSEDSQYLAFAAGTSYSYKALYAAPADKTNCCTTKRLYPTSGGLRYWQIFSVK